MEEMRSASGISLAGRPACGPYGIAMDHWIFIVYTVPISVDTF